VNKKRYASLLVLLGAAIYGWFGGEFSTPEYLEMKHAEVVTRDSLLVLKTEVDSLTLFRDSLATSPAVQERYAREKWGMLRPGELGFKIVPADSVKH
jgi:cell division protein FtsB